MSLWTDLVAYQRDLDGVTRSLKVATLAQWALESGRGTSELATRHLNCAGLKFRARMAGYATPVDYTGSDGETTTYCAFESIEAFVKGYWHFIETGPYDGWEAMRDDAAGYIRLIAKAGYAASPTYMVDVFRLFGEAERLLFGEPSAEQPGTGTGHATSETGDVRFRLAVVIGHNALSTGAMAVAPISRSEFAFNGVVAKHMKRHADHYNLVVEIFRREAVGSYSKEIRAVYDEVAAWGAQATIELHFNSYETTSTGTTVLHARSDAAGHAHAKAVQKSVVALLGLHDRGLSPLDPGDRGAGSVYALADTASILVEPFFGSNPDDCTRMAEVGEENLALAYLRGTRDWLETA